VFRFFKFSLLPLPLLLPCPVWVVRNDRARDNSSRRGGGREREREREKLPSSAITDVLPTPLDNRVILPRDVIYKDTLHLSLKRRLRLRIMTASTTCALRGKRERKRTPSSSSSSSSSSVHRLRETQARRDANGWKNPSRLSPITAYRFISADIYTPINHSSRRVRVRARDPPPPSPLPPAPPALLSRCEDRGQQRRLLASPPLLFPARLRADIDPRAVDPFRTPGQDTGGGGGGRREKGVGEG